MGVGVGVALGVTFGTGIKLPLFQTSFIPDFMQVYLIPFKTDVLPIFEQALPGFTAANAVELIATENETAMTMNAFRDRIVKGTGAEWSFSIYSI